MVFNRNRIRLSQNNIVEMQELLPGRTFPLVIKPGFDDVNLVHWARENRDMINSKLFQHGAILFRGFNIESVLHFEQVAGAICEHLINYVERAAPRREVCKNVFTSTEYPADQFIQLHHEMSYSHNWPAKIMFFCTDPAKEGGATPLSDDRQVLKLIPAQVLEKFLQKKVMYVRNFGEGVDLTWQEAFQTDDPLEVEEYCHNVRMEFQWLSDGRLQTRAVRQVIAVHPITFEKTWFNHAHIFHKSALEPDLLDILSSQFEDDEFPRNVFYGDGSQIETAALDEIRRVYSETAVRHVWQKDDVLLLDNFLTSHGREPYTGNRKVFVAMADLYTNNETL